MDFSLHEANEDDRVVLRRLVELYRYDFSEFDQADVGFHGEFGYRYLDHYWTESDRQPFLFRVDNNWAGFALVREIPPYDMAEFFVMRKYRRVGVGGRMAMDLFDRFPGTWQIRQQLDNPAATAFWRRVIPHPYVERTTAQEIVQEFTSPPRAPRPAPQRQPGSPFRPQRH
jgi:predicted acetyltransferase